MAQRLATLIHISDLHFGKIFKTEAGLIKSLLVDVPMLGEYFQGSYQHSYIAARALARRINQIIRDEKTGGHPVCVVFTGDLTSRGEENEFIVGATFLRQSHETGGGDPVGLNLGAAPA